MRQTTLVLLLAISVAASLPGQTLGEDSITLCGVSLKLGMDREGTMHQLVSACDAKPFDTEGKMWNLYEKSNPAIEVGSVAFFSGKVGHVSRNWITTRDAWDLVEALYFVAKNFQAEHHISCNLRNDYVEQPGMSFKRVTLQCGGKTIIMVAGQQKAERSPLSVTENLP